MEVQTKQTIEEVIIKLTPRDFASIGAVKAVNYRLCALVNDLTPDDVPFEDRENEQKNDQNRKHGLYYNVVFDHINWNQAQQLQTMAKKAGIHFGKIERE
jgi:hypothetical protein